MLYEIILCLLVNLILFTIKLTVYNLLFLLLFSLVGLKIYKKVNQASYVDKLLIKGYTYASDDGSLLLIKIAVTLFEYLFISQHLISYILITGLAITLFLLGVYVNPFYLIVGVFNTLYLWQIIKDHHIKEIIKFKENMQLAEVDSDLYLSPEKNDNHLQKQRFQRKVV